MRIILDSTELFKCGVCIFTGTEEICCPCCGGRLKVHGTCLRKLRTADETKIYRLRVMECTNCGKTHRELPESIVPYMRMDVNLLSAIAQAERRNHLSLAETSTWKRVKAWCGWFLCYARNIMNSLTEQNEKFSAVTTPGGGFGQQLMYFVRLVVNSGNWIQHRLAQRLQY